MKKNDWLKLIGMIISLAIEHAPDIIESIKEFIANLNKSEWTTEEIKALVEKMKEPEDYTPSSP
jgi:hypothetical protein